MHMQTGKCIASSAYSNWCIETFALPSRLTMGLNAAGKYRLYAKKFQIKVVKISITLSGVELGAPKIAMFEIL